MLTACYRLPPNSPYKHGHIRKALLMARSLLNLWDVNDPRKPVLDLKVPTKTLNATPNMKGRHTAYWRTLDPYPGHPHVQGHLGFEDLKQGDFGTRRPHFGGILDGEALDPFNAGLRAAKTVITTIHNIPPCTPICSPFLGLSWMLFCNFWYENPKTTTNGPSGRGSKYPMFRKPYRMSWLLDPGPQIWATIMPLWSQIPDTAAVSYTLHVSQTDIGNHLGPCSTTISNMEALDAEGQDEDSLRPPGHLDPCRRHLVLREMAVKTSRAWDGYVDSRFPHAKGPKYLHVSTQGFGSRNRNCGRGYVFHIWVLRPLGSGSKVPAYEVFRPCTMQGITTVISGRYRRFGYSLLGIQGHSRDSLQLRHHFREATLAWNKNIWYLHWSLQYMAISPNPLQHGVPQPWFSPDFDAGPYIYFSLFWNNNPLPLVINTPDKPYNQPPL